MKKFILLALVFISGHQTSEAGTDKAVVTKETNIFESSNDSWWQTGQDQLSNRLKIQPVSTHAKNIILFIGDGMGVTTVTAARIFDGQTKGSSGEENVLAFERFPYLALIKTYSSDSQVPDSASTASAMNSGIKTRNRVINLWADQNDRACPGAHQQFPRTLAERAESTGMATGIVTTTRVTHATPAAVYGHSPNRRWENDADLPAWARRDGCLDLTRQLVDFPFGDGIDVIFGGGRENFIPRAEGGKRGDSKNLIHAWQRQGTNSGIKREYIDQASYLRSTTDNPQQVLGLFSNSHMAYEADRDEKSEPSLAEMTERAIDHLSQNKKGYFLMVEGGRIDHAHHETNAYRALQDTRAFSKAVATAITKIDLSETLVLVTADHAHAFTMAGYPKRGNDILGLVHPVTSVEQASLASPSLADDGHPYTTLGYLNGPNARGISHQPLTEKQVVAEDFLQQSAIPFKVETHSGADVALYAIGPLAHLVGGVIEQHTIFHIMAYALGWQFK